MLRPDKAPCLRSALFRLQTTASPTQSAQHSPPRPSACTPAACADSSRPTADTPRRPSVFPTGRLPARCHARTTARRATRLPRPACASVVLRSWLARSNHHKLFLYLHSPRRLPQHLVRLAARTIHRASRLYRRTPQCHSTQVTTALVLCHSATPTATCAAAARARYSGAVAHSGPTYG